MHESTRQQWREASRRLAAEKRDPIRYGQLCDLVDVVVAELRRRVGQHFTLSELASAHAGADDWVREVVRDATPAKPRAGTRDTALVGDAAFDLYARGASDWSP
jgi:hypothetical protein